MGFTPDIEEDESAVSINFNNLVDNGEASQETSPAPKKRGRPKKETGLQVVDKNGVVSVNDQNQLPMWQSNESYMNTYSPTSFLLYGVIQDVDDITKDVKTQIEVVRDSKTSRDKAKNIAELASAASSLLGGKLRAIQELNSSITQAHNLDLKRTKELKMTQLADSQNDDKYIMDLYNAYINTPIGTYGPGLTGPTFTDIMNPAAAVTGVDIVAPGESVDIGFAQYQATKTPEQNRMTLQAINPDIKTVVVYDQATQAKRFDCIDTKTGQSVPNMPLPNPAFLDDTVVNIVNGVARNSNLDAVYPLVVVGQRTSIDDY